MGKLKRAVFLDRDGTLNRDTGYVHSQAAWEWLPEVPKALADLKLHGWFLVIVSNQSGIARGMFSAGELHALESWVNTQLAPINACIDAWYHCPHLPDLTGPCSCRKPAPGMLLQAAQEHALNLTASWMIGDARRDIQAGLAAGTKCIKVGRTEDLSWYAAQQVPVVADLPAAVQWLREHC